MIELRQGTAGQEVPLGYFLDSADGDTEETGLTIANTDIKIWKWGATTLANKNSGGATHISNGIYYCTLDATDTDTPGPLVIFVHVAGALVVRLECAVLIANVWDSKYSTDKLQIDVRQINGLSTEGNNATLRLKQLHVSNNEGSAIIASSTGSNGHGISASSNGSGHGLVATGGSTGVGIAGFGGSSSGPGILGLAQGNNDFGMKLVKHGTGKDIDADEIDAIKAVTDNLPNSGALTDIDTGINNLESRLTATRAGYLDELAAANMPADLDAVLADTNELQTDNVPGLIAALNNISAAEVNAQVDAALSDIDLDHLIQVDAGAEEPTDGSYLDQIMHKDASQTFNAATDSLEAIIETGNSSWITSKNLDVANATHTYTVLDGEGNGIADVLVEAKQAGSDVLIQSARTNSSGVATFYLAAGTYDFYATKAGYSFNNPDQEVVS